MLQAINILLKPAGCRRLERGLDALELREHVLRESVYARLSIGQGRTGEISDGLCSLSGALSDNSN